MVVKSLKNLVSKQKDYYFTLCTPAKIEYAISVIGISALAISCLTSGSGSKLEDTCTDIIPYILVCSIFVFILNALCKGGASIVSWIMVLCPLCALFVSVNNKAPVATEGFDATSDALKEFKDAMEEASEQFDSSRDDDEDYDDEDDNEDYDDDDDEDYDEAEEMFDISDMEFYEDQEPYNDDDMPQIKTKKNEYAAEKASKEEGAPQENFGVLDDLADVLEQKKDEAYKAMQKIKDTITGKKEEKKEDFGVLDDLADVLEQKKDEAYNKIKAIGKLLRGDNEQFGNIKPASYYKY
jgi:hypothetical protein